LDEQPIDGLLKTTGKKWQEISKFVQKERIRTKASEVERLLRQQKGFYISPD
jgi:hypothetical protein